MRSGKNNAKWVFKGSFQFSSADLSTTQRRAIRQIWCEVQLPGSIVRIVQWHVWGNIDRWIGWGEISDVTQHKQSLAGYRCQVAVNEGHYVEARRGLGKTIMSNMKFVQTRKKTKITEGRQKANQAEELDPQTTPYLMCAQPTWMC